MTDPSAQGKKVLVIEDEMMIFLVIEDALTKIGAVVVGPASRVNAALQLASEAFFDAAILDINIRDGDTYAVADILGERGIPFVFCSGYNEWAVQERHRNRPRLTKPYTSKELEEGVLRILGVPLH